MQISNQAEEIYKNAVVIDGQLGFEPAMPVSLEQKWELVDRYARAGITAVTLSLANDESTPEQTLEYLATIRKHIAAYPEKYILATTADDIVRAKRENKMALRLMFQGTAPIGKNLNFVELYHRLGISSMILAYNIRTPMGDGVIEENDAGLSHLGKKLVAEMNAVGMIVDGSHTSYKTMMDAAHLSNLPMVISHSGIFGVNPHVRNLRDDQISAIAKTNGVVGINGLGLLLGDQKASIEKFVEHVDYVVKQVGAKHVAIGLDNLYFAENFGEFMRNQPITHPQAYATKVSSAITWACIQPEQVLEIVEHLLQRGYSEESIRGILGENILRVMKAHELKV